MTGKQKADYIAKIGSEFNALIGRKLTNLKYSNREENEVTLREMISDSTLNHDKIVKIIYPRN